ncbi:MAG: class I SAM-dependent methyltransferase [Bdellovibrionales bacterium]|nr:class I SAM-dependent methyltransferase [Bdellovibrionales bacterium]
MCGSFQGHEVSRGRFWDLKDVSFVRCPQCGLTQTDPMLDDETTALGCQAYFLRESLREGPRNLEKKMIRAFRKGVYFGLLLKKRKISPLKILEIGAGDGYFSRGVHFIFPNAEVTCLDVVKEALDFVEQAHGFKTLWGTPENINTLSNHQTYDLIIARDLLEHVRDPGLVMREIYRSLSPGGGFHFITPNGYEDIWLPYCRWKLRHEPCQMLINHVSYFDPQGLRRYLQNIGFRKKIWFTYDFNGTRWGQGRRLTEKQMAEPVSEISAQKTIEEFKAKALPLGEISDPLMRKWWYSSFAPLLTQLYCTLKESRLFVLSADLGIGHEIFGYFVKPLLRQG